MKPLVLAAVLTLPGLASASLGPVITQSQAEQAQTHLVHLAWSQAGETATPDCTKPSAPATPVLYACVVFPEDQ